MSRYFDPEHDFLRTAYCGPNDGGVKRGDGAETGDNEARPTAHEEISEMEDLTILGKDDPALGLTNVAGVPPEDWAADTGATQVPEGEDPIAWEPADPKLTSKRKRSGPPAD